MNNLRDLIPQLLERLTTIRGIFDVATKQRRVLELEARCADPELWNNAEEATKVQREMSDLKQRVESFPRIGEFSC